MDHNYPVRRRFTKKWSRLCLKCFPAFSDAVKILGVIIIMPMNCQSPGHCILIQNRMEQLLGITVMRKGSIAFNKMMEDWDPFGNLPFEFSPLDQWLLSRRKKIVEQGLRARSEARTRLAELAGEIRFGRFSGEGFPDVGELKIARYWCKLMQRLWMLDMEKQNQILIGSTSLPSRAVENISKRADWPKWLVCRFDQKGISSSRVYNRESLMPMNWFRFVSTQCDWKWWSKTWWF